MPLQTLHLLCEGDPSIALWYAEAAAQWKVLLGEQEDRVFALRVTASQSWFEAHCGGRDVGREIMAYSAFAALWDPRLGVEHARDTVRRLRVAFRRSRCSVEVKGYAERAARMVLGAARTRRPRAKPLPGA